MNSEHNFQEPDNEKIEQKLNALHSVTPLSKYLAMILFIAMPFIGGYIGYTYAPEKIVEIELSLTSEEQNSQEDISVIKNAAEFAEPALKNTENILTAIKVIREKYGQGYGSGPAYIGLLGNRFWFAEPNHNMGCSNYSYFEMDSTDEVETQLTSCPLIYTYPFHAVLCSRDLDSQVESLCVTNLLTMEEKKIPLTKVSTETIIRECHEATYDTACSYDIQTWDGDLLVRIYQSTPREPFEIYENTELLREENINLFKEFGLE